ncbi:MAG: SufD family Fe-S cluster assembly protein [Lachnospiraceae bacterium]|nr:SufD family Fe-S cluster assembly protein [Lachnospiraceae bacterium]
MINMQVNEMPASTYRWLHMNESHLKNDAAVFRKTLEKPSQVPEGVMISYDVEAHVAETVFAQKHEEMLQKEAVRISLPNGDLDRRHQAQVVRTGMGIDVDRLLEEEQVKATVITAKANCKIEEPVVFCDAVKSKEAVLSRQVIVAEENSHLTVVMSYDSPFDAEGFYGISTKLYVEKGADVTLVKVQILGRNTDHFDDIGGVVMDGGHVNLVVLELGAGRAWHGCHINLCGKQATLQDEMGYFCNGNQKLDINYVAEQNGNKTDSKMICRGILADASEKIFRGSLDFRLGSEGSVGDEQEDVLLLSDEVVNRTIPLIFCEEADVDGRHGASIGQLGDEMLFYMLSRGIDREMARKMMILARLQSITRQIPVEALRNRADAYVEQICERG